MHLDGFGLSGYRSFGNEVQKIGPLKKINFFIGQNNSGKSNILLFLKNHFHSVFQDQQGRQRVPIKFSLLDKNLGYNQGPVRFAIALNLDGNNYEVLKNKYSEIIKDSPILSKLLDSLLTSEPLSKNTRIAWFPYIASSLSSVISLDVQIVHDLSKANIFNPGEWYSLWHHLTKATGGDIIKHWIPEILSSVSPITFDYPDIELIPAIRKIGEAGVQASSEYSGVGIIDMLARIQNPRHDEQHYREKFQKINEFVKEVVNNDTASLEIPYDRDMITVHMDGKTLPLSSLGTGIHEVVILAAAATVLEKKILCIEEPELHLHPLLQKRLCKYLSEKTNNQYIISTHSAHLLDTPDTAIFHVRYENGATTVENVMNTNQKTSIFADLGYRASDLLQSNCIIWVEGPSDRIYLNHWILTCKPELIEGIHYSIMFYGGRLLSHLTADDIEVNEFISLRRLNRFISIVIDSDKSNQKDSINRTKNRIKEEFDKGPGHAWITKGKEIENYIEPAVMESAIKSIYPKAVELHNIGPFAHRYWYKDQENEVIQNVDKVKIAHKIAGEKINYEILDLKVQIKRLINFICEANDLKS